MKYTLLIGIAIIASLLFINRDEIFARYSGNFAEVSGGTQDYYNPTEYELETVIDKFSFGTINGESKGKTVKKTAGEEITLVAEPKKGYVFVEWSDACFGVDKTCKFKMDSDKKAIAKFDRCYQPYPRAVYFPSVNALERKLVEFAKNKPDTGMGVTAQGETAALAVEHADGGVCAKFVSGCNGTVTCDYGVSASFLRKYRGGVSVNKVVDYHTHDSASNKSAKENPEWGMALYNKLKRVYVIPLPSPADLALDYAQESTRIYTNALNAHYISKVISPDGYGYIYDAPLSTKSTFGTQASSNAFSDKVLRETVKAFTDSFTLHGRTFETATDGDVRAGFDVNARLYQNIGVKFESFTVR